MIKNNPPLWGEGGGQKIMSKFRHAKRDAKKAAYAAKQEKEGQSVINWIFGVLIVLGAIYAIYTIMFVG